MKGLILAAGLGTRLRPLTSLRPKPLIAVANKALILHAVDNLVEAGVRDIGVVVGPVTKPYIEQALIDYPSATFTFILQDPPEGLAHAVKVSRAFLKDDPFVMYLGDNLFQEGITSFVNTFDPKKNNAVLALVKVEDPRAFGVAVVENGRIVHLVEKPSDPPSNLAVAGVYVFDASVHEVIETLPRGAKNEYQITDAIQAMITQGRTVAPMEVQGWWKDTGNPEDILDANRLLLLDLQSCIKSTVEETEIIGQVAIGEGAVIKNSRIVGPVSIAAHAHIENAYVGPFTSIGARAVVQDAEIEYAVLEEGSRIISVKTRLQASLIGIGVTVTSRNIRPKTHKLILGDKGHLQLHE